MNLVHIIGNGFDLNQGLPTSYAHFYEYYFQLVRITQIAIGSEEHSMAMDIPFVVL